MDKAFKVAKKPNTSSVASRYISKPKHRRSNFHGHRSHRHYHHYNKWAKENQKLFNSLNYVMVITGYHYGWRKSTRDKGKKAFYPHISFKPYNFKVNYRTKNIKLACENKAKTAKVKTAKGVKNLYITHISQITNKFGSAVINEAKKLQPVNSFSSKLPKKKWFKNAINRRIKINNNK